MLLSCDHWVCDVHPAAADSAVRAENELISAPEDLTDTWEAGQGRRRPQVYAG